MPAKPKADFLALAKKAASSEEIVIPEMDMTVVAKSLSSKAIRLITEACLKDGKTPADENAYDEERLTMTVVAGSLYDTSGKRLIPDGREEELFDLPNTILARLQTAALRVNGMTVEPEGNG